MTFAEDNNEPRSLWEHIESNLQPQEVFTIRRVIGENVLGQNEGLWREVDALGEILQEAQGQNQELFDKLAARRIMPIGLERIMLETHLRLLLGKLGAGGSRSSVSGRSSNLCRHSHDGECDDQDFGKRSANRAHGRRKQNVDEGMMGQGQEASRPNEFRRSDGSSSAPSRTLHAIRILSVPLETHQDRVVYEFLATGGSQNPSGGLSGIGGELRRMDSRGGGPEFKVEGCSRPATTKRPDTSGSTRSAPEWLESGRNVSTATIDAALGDLRAAFGEEAKNLLKAVADLTSLVEDEARLKTDAERRCRVQPRIPGSSGGGSGVASCELRRYGKKLEEAVRLREYAVDMAERLAVDRPLSLQQRPGRFITTRETKESSRRMALTRKTQVHAAIVNNGDGSPPFVGCGIEKPRLESLRPQNKMLDDDNIGRGCCYLCSRGGEVGGSDVPGECTCTRKLKGNATIEGRYMDDAHDVSPASSRGDIPFRPGGRGRRGDWGVCGGGSSCIIMGTNSARACDKLRETVREARERAALDDEDRYLS